MKRNLITRVLSLLTASAAILCVSASVQAADKKPNILMLMKDDTGWFDFGCYGGGTSLGHPTPNIDQLAKEGADVHELVWSGELHGRPRLVHYRAYPDPLGPVGRGRAGRRESSCRSQTPTIAEFFKKNGYTTYFSGKWHLGDQARSSTRSSTASTK